MRRRGADVQLRHFPHGLERILGGPLIKQTVDGIVCIQDYDVVLEDADAGYVAWIVRSVDITQSRMTEITTIALNKCLEREPRMAS